MLRFDDCICGTSTTGTGTLTLAAPPAAFGGIDPDVWARATGIGFGNSAAMLVDYTITEYTDSTSLKEKQKESGTGTLTLGASSGVANCTLARTTIDWTATSLDAQPASVNVKPGTGITIGTAANVLVMIAPRAESVPGFHPYHNNEGDANWGVCPDGMERAGSPGAGLSFSAGAVRDFYIPFRWSVPMLVKRCSFRIQTYSTVSGSPAVYVRLYGPSSSNNRPSKLLYDFTGASGIAITATGNYSTGAAGNGFMLMPGDYWLDLCCNGQSAGTINFTAGSAYYAGGNSPSCGRLGLSAGNAFAHAIATGATGAAPDPANLTGWIIETLNASSGQPVFGLNDA